VIAVENQLTDQMQIRINIYSAKNALLNCIRRYSRIMTAKNRKRGSPPKRTSPRANIMEMAGII